MSPLGSAIKPMDFSTFYSSDYEASFLSSISCFSPDSQHSYYHSVPTDETSIIGRQKRKKQNQFNYLSALCCENNAPCPVDRPAQVHSMIDALPGNQDQCPRSVLSDEATSSVSKDTGPVCKMTPRPVEDTDCTAVLGPKLKRKRGAVSKREGQSTSERSSRFRGVTKHRRSGRWEAHIWIKEMGRQVYLGGYEKEAKSVQLLVGFMLRKQCSLPSRQTCPSALYD